jgi:cell division protein FtsL
VEGAALAVAIFAVIIAVSAAWYTHQERARLRQLKREEKKAKKRRRRWLY